MLGLGLWLVLERLDTTCKPGLASRAHVRDPHLSHQSPLSSRGLILLQVPEQLPRSDYHEYFAPDFSLNVSAHKVRAWDRGTVGRLRLRWHGLGAIELVGRTTRPYRALPFTRAPQPTLVLVMKC